MTEQDFDLFGDPVRLPSGRRGRPAHQATQKNRNKVIMLLAMGWSGTRIANALHISLPTLRRHYFSELKAREVQRDRFDAWRLEVLVEQSRTGNVGAMRELNKVVEKNDLMRQAAKMAAEPEDPPEEKLGKKEQARRRALETARTGGAWGKLLQPEEYEH